MLPRTDSVAKPDLAPPLESKAIEVDGWDWPDCPPRGTLKPAPITGFRHQVDQLRAFARVLEHYDARRRVSS